MSTITLSPAQEKYYRIAQRLSSVLGRKFGVSVVFGHHPSTDGTRVFLPHWDLDNPLAVRALYGCVAHEAGGHVAMSSFDALSAWCAVHRNEPYFKTLKSIENICEDIRIEHHLFRKYPGTRLDIDAALEMVMLGEGEPATDYWPAVVNWLLLRFRSRLLRQTLLDDVAGVSDAILSSMVDRSVLDEADRLGETILAFGPTKSDHARVFALADQLFDLFDRNKPSSQPDPEPESKPEPEKGEKDDKGQLPDGDQPEASSPEGPPEAGPPGDGPADTSGTPFSGDPAGQAPGNGKGKGASPSVDESYLDSVLGDPMADLMASMDPGQPLPLPAGTGAGLEAGSNEVSNVGPRLATARTLSGRLIPALAPLLSGGILRDDPRKRGRSLLGSRLVDTKAHPAPRVFEKRSMVEDESAQVHILVDRSSSTRGSVYEAITDSALGLAIALEAYTSVETAVSHFPAGEHDLALNATKTTERTVRDALARWPVPHGGTPLAAAMRSAGLQFLASSKTRRIILVITDGKPAAIDECVRARGFATSLGVEIYGVVVSPETYPRHLFDDSEQIQAATDLPRAIERLVLRIL
jgi:hypothetical protein